jgi:uncharacterized membrane protein
MMKAKEYRALAREKLQGHWGAAVLTGFVASLLGGITVSSPTFSTRFETDDLSEILEKFGVEDGVTNSVELEQMLQQLEHVPAFVWVLIAVVTSILAIWGIATFILGGPVRAGYCNYNINLMNGEGKFEDLFSRFNIFIKAFLAKLLVGIITAIGYVLLIVPGILATYGLQMTFYILAEHPEMDPFDAIKASWNMMKGYKWKLFCLQFSFIGWSFLCIFTLGIGALFLTPYIEASTAAFYKSISEPKVELIEEYTPAQPAE